MSYQYEIFRETLFHPDIGNYCTFGIQCCFHHPKQEILSLSDISTNKAFVKKLAHRFTRGQLSPIHLKCAVEDALFLP